MSVKKPVVPAAAEAPAAEAKPARKTAKSAVKTEKAPKTEKTAHKGRPPLSPEIYVEFAGKQYNITDLVDRAKADYRLTHKVGVQSCKIYVKPEEEAAYYVVNKVGGKLPPIWLRFCFSPHRKRPELFCQVAVQFWSFVLQCYKPIRSSLTRNAGSYFRNLCTARATMPPRMPETRNSATPWTPTSSTTNIRGLAAPLTDTRFWT